MILKLESVKKRLKNVHRSLLKRCNEFRKIHYIELLIFVFYLAQGLRASANFPSLYSKVCLEIYSAESEVCDNLKQDRSAENLVQQETARWLMFNELITFFPNLITAMIFGSYGDKYDRKVPTLISVASMVIHNFLYMLFISIPAIPVYALIIEAGVVALGGTKTVFLSAQYAEAANQTEDKDRLTQRFSILTACMSCGIFIAGNVSPLLFKQELSLPWIMAVGQFVMTLAFVLAILCHSPAKTDETATHSKKASTASALSQRSASSTEPTTREVNENVASNGNASKKVLKRFKNTHFLRTTSVELFGRAVAPRKIYTPVVNLSNNVKQQPVETSTTKRSDFVELVYRTINLYKSAWRAVSRKRPNHGRCHLLVFCFVGLIYASADSGMDTVITLYVYREPIAWTPSIFSRWMATVSVVQLIGGITGTHLLKRFHFSDYTVLLVGIVSTILKMTVITAASNTWMMYLAMVLGCLSSIGVSSLRSLVANLGDPDETGELTSMLSIVMGWSQLTGSILCNNIYTVTLTYFAGSTFAVIGVLLIFCATLIVFIRYDDKKMINEILSRRESAVFYLDTIQ